MERVLCALLFFFVVVFPTACQHSEDKLSSPLVFRVESAEGQPYSGVPNFSGTAWFGEAHAFQISSVEQTMSSDGSRAILVQFAEEDAVAFSDFSESNIGFRMAIEVEGRIIAAPYIDSRLPGGCLITFGSNGLTKTEVEDLLEALGRDLE